MPITCENHKINAIFADYRLYFDSQKQKSTPLPLLINVYAEMAKY